MLFTFLRSFTCTVCLRFLSHFFRAASSTLNSSSQAYHSSQQEKRSSLFTGFPVCACSFGVFSVVDLSMLRRWKLSFLFIIINRRALYTSADYKFAHRHGQRLEVSKSFTVSQVSLPYSTVQSFFKGLVVRQPALYPPHKTDKTYY